MDEVGKPRLLLLSAVLPVPATSGQRRRVLHTLRSLRTAFRVTLVTIRDPKMSSRDEALLEDLCDELILLESLYLTQGGLSKTWHRLSGALYAQLTGLKFSNYLIGKLEFSPTRLVKVIDPSAYDIVLFEYWHAWASTSIFRARGVPCVLDMHDVLARSYEKQLDQASRLPSGMRRRKLSAYARREREAWEHFDALVAINEEEAQHARETLAGKASIFCIPMGLDLAEWPYRPAPAEPPRVGFYGGLGSRHNHVSAMYCLEQVMPRVWREFPETELWLIGSHPRRELLDIKHPRVTVTGHVEEITKVLGSLVVLLCPWIGRYGFRSRLIEALATGVPVIASPDAVYGMDLQAGKGLQLEENAEVMAERCIDLIRDRDAAAEQSRLGRAQVEERYGFEATYGRLTAKLLELAATRRVPS